PFPCYAGHCRKSLSAASPSATRRARPQSPTTKPSNGDPSAESLSGVCRLRCAFCICDRCIGQWAPRYPVDPEYTPLDFGSLVISQHRDPAGRTMGLRGTGVGWLLGLGSSRKCLVYAMVNGYSVSPFGNDSGKKRHAQSLEYGFGYVDLCSFYLRHISHAQWGNCLSACFCPIFSWSLLSALSCRDFGRRSCSACQAFAAVAQ